MAEEHEDKSQKTEQPTEHRLEEGRKRGQLAVSKEITHWFMLLAATLLIGVLLPYSLERIAMILRSFLEFADSLVLSGDELVMTIATACRKIAFYMGLPFLFLIIGALTGTFIQTKFNFSLEPLKPKLEKISLIKGLGRLFSKKTLMEFFKALFKFLLISSVAVLIMLPEFHKIDSLLQVNMFDLIGELHEQITFFLIIIVGLITLLAGIDYAFQKYTFYQEMRMTKQEVKEEFKQLEGDPHVKRKLRQIRQERARQNLSKAVPEATVVVTNPTHYSVALKYDMNEMEAPVVVAKGMDLVALKIRELAKENDIPLYRNPPLARLLYSSVELNEPIDEEHYEAVAKVIRYVMELKGHRFDQPA